MADLHSASIKVEVKIPLWVRVLGKIFPRVAIQCGHFDMRFLPNGKWERVQMSKYS